MQRSRPTFRRQRISLLFSPALNFCSVCGKATEIKVPEGDNRLRAVCSGCATIHYQNPKIVVGCLPVWQDRILLCKRAIEPRYGRWTLPAGFMENGESAVEGAMREAVEEANAKVEITQLYTTYSIPSISQVYIMFLANLLDPNVSAGPESLDVKLATEAEIPWDDLAFVMVKHTLRHYLNDRRTGIFTPRFGDIRPPER
ncbi:MAG: NUDIX hydrolase [Betaproteobacteria bacterium]|nr:NUDIX hydrolase [Betaproteobacteria bacterium]